MKKSTKIVIFSTLCAAFIAALIVGSIYDLEISNELAQLTPRVYYSQNRFATIFETFGESAVYVLCVAALAILFFKIKKTAFRKNYVKWLLTIIILLLSLAITVYGVLKVVSYLKIHTNLEDFFMTTASKVLLGIVMASIMLAIYSVCGLIREQTLDSLYKWAIAVLAVAALSNAITQVAKHIFCRTRFRAMIYEGQIDSYTPWFIINTNKFASVGDYFKSFPSGHCCAAASVFLLLLLPVFYPKFNHKPFKISMTIACTAYTLCVMLSRIVAGAHFFTDTLIGSGITIACIVAYYFAIIKNKKVKYLSA